MIRLKFSHTLPAICVALMLTACGGESSSSSSSSTASTASASAPKTGRTAATSRTGHVEETPQTMTGFANLDSTCYANSALKFLMHSISPRPLKNHLHAFAQNAQPLQREAAQSFIALIDKSFSDNGPTPQELSDFFDLLQQLPAFASKNEAGQWRFPIVGQQHDLNEFLKKLSESFALHTARGINLALKDDTNQFKSQEAYWTILQPVSSDDTLQAMFDRTQGAGWEYNESLDVAERLTVKIDNTLHLQASQMHSNRRFDFNQTVRLRFTEGEMTTTLILEPREVVEFRGIDNAGHYVVYAKDEQWVRYDDDQVTVLSQMPAIENARFINFAIRHVATHFETSSGS